MALGIDVTWMGDFEFWSSFWLILSDLFDLHRCGCARKLYLALRLPGCGSFQDALSVMRRFVNSTNFIHLSECRNITIGWNHAWPRKWQHSSNWATCPLNSNSLSSESVFDLIFLWLIWLNLDCYSVHRSEYTNAPLTYFLIVMLITPQH